MMWSRRCGRLLGVVVGVSLLAALPSGIVNAATSDARGHAAPRGDSAPLRVHGERAPGGGVLITVGDQTCLLKARGDCRSVLKAALASGRVVFSGEFPRMRFVGLRLRNANFSRVRLAGVDFRGARLTGADFTGADLRNADFSPKPKVRVRADGRLMPRETKCQSVGDVDIYCDQAHLDGAKFDYADMRGVDFSHATMTRVQMWHSDATNANFTLATLERSVLQYSTFDGAIFNTTLLRSAGVAANTFNGANMYKALFYGASVTENDFIGTDLTKANFQGALLRYNDFTGAVWSSTTCPDYSKTNTGCPQQS